MVDEVSGDDVEGRIARVAGRMEAALASFEVGPLLADFWRGGKMLRGRLAFRVGPAAGVPVETLECVAASVEMLHAATLLHDDVIDGGRLRRNAPAFWVTHGVRGAILAGDFLLFQALAQLDGAGRPALVSHMIEAIGAVCAGEVAQEIGGTEPTWDAWLDLARKKTGGLFGFVAGACAGDDEARRAALTEAGILAGAAYQLADDIADASGDPAGAGKTLGTDRARGIATALSWPGADRATLLARIDGLVADSAATLAPFPAIAQAWDRYIQLDMRPALDRCTAAAPK